MPAQFVGRLFGSRLTITVTIAKTTVVRGPAAVTFGVEPRMQNGPICRVPGVRATRS